MKPRACQLKQAGLPGVVGPARPTHPMRAGPTPPPPPPAARSFACARAGVAVGSHSTLRAAVRVAGAGGTGPATAIRPAAQSFGPPPAAEPPRVHPAPG